MEKERDTALSQCKTLKKKKSNESGKQSQYLKNTERYEHAAK